MQTYNTNATDKKYDETHFACSKKSHIYKISRISQSMDNVIHRLLSSMFYWNAKYRKLREK